MSNNFTFPDLLSWGGCGTEYGSCLPPRKRLLAGLKQKNCSHTYAAAWNSIGATWQGAMEDLKLEVDLQDSKSGDDSPPGDRCPKQQAETTVQDMIKSEICSSQLDDQSMNRSVGKKPRLVVEEFLDPISVSSHENGVIVSYKEKAAAARLAAEKAAKSAAEAKEFAAKTAANAAKAAMTARAALEVVIRVAYKESQRSQNSSHRKIGKIERKGGSQFTETRLSQTGALLDDEELAVQLHRTMSSSPCLAHFFTPVNFGLDPSQCQRHCRPKTHRNLVMESVELVPRRKKSKKPDVKIKSMSVINQLLSLKDAGFVGHNIDSDRAVFQLQAERKGVKSYKEESLACSSSKELVDSEIKSDMKEKEASVEGNATDTELDMEHCAAVGSKDIVGRGRMLKWKLHSESLHAGCDVKMGDAVDNGREVGPCKYVDSHMEYCSQTDDDDQDNSSLEESPKSKPKF